MGDLLNKTILASRWVLAAFYLGLAVALALYSVKFALKLADFAYRLFWMEDAASLFTLLYLLDSALVAGLIVTVALASWDTLVLPLRPTAEREKLGWIAKADHGNLKIKLATALVAISSIELLQKFLDVEHTEDRVLYWALGLYGAFVLGAIGLALADRLEAGAAGRTGRTGRCPDP